MPDYIISSLVLSKDQDLQESPFDLPFSKGLKSPDLTFQAHLNTWRNEMMSEERMLAHLPNCHWHELGPQE